MTSVAASALAAQETGMANPEIGHISSMIERARLAVGVVCSFASACAHSAGVNRRRNTMGAHLFEEDMAPVGANFPVRTARRYFKTPYHTGHGLEGTVPLEILATLGHEQSNFCLIAQPSGD
jgi:hypothetical protein